MYPFLYSKGSVIVQNQVIYNYNKMSKEDQHTSAEGTVIVQHQVIYDYNQMSPEDQQLSADEIFEETMKVAIDNGNLGTLPLVECSDCELPTCKCMMFTIIHNFAVKFGNIRFNHQF